MKPSPHSLTKKKHKLDEVRGNGGVTFSVKNESCGAENNHLA